MGGADGEGLSTMSGKGSHRGSQWPQRPDWVAASHCFKTTHTTTAQWHGRAAA